MSFAFTCHVFISSPQLAAQMNSLEELYHALRQAGSEPLAPVLVSHGVLSVNQITLRFGDLVAAGVPPWQLEATLAASSQRAEVAPEEAPQVGRVDLPTVVTQRRANLQAALMAAEPNNRVASLKKLEDDILAKSTNPANDARLKTYLAICRAWEVVSFPLDTNNIRCFAASLKAGGYKSSAIYFSTLCGYQQRTLRTPISPWFGRPSRTAFGPSSEALV
jgi:hypothetical protein